jgi:hypothetical protein
MFDDPRTCRIFQNSRGRSTKAKTFSKLSRERQSPSCFRICQAKPCADPRYRLLDANRTTGRFVVTTEMASSSTCPRITCACAPSIETSRAAQLRLAMDALEKAFARIADAI